MTVSAGVAADSGGHIRYEDLFRSADSALLEAKRAGRNRVETAGGLSELAFATDRHFSGDPSAVKP
jgi:hypothetical protein